MKGIVEDFWGGGKDNFWGWKKEKKKKGGKTPPSINRTEPICNGSVDGLN